VAPRGAQSFDGFEEWEPLQQFDSSSGTSGTSGSGSARSRSGGLGSGRNRNTTTGIGGIGGTGGAGFGTQGAQGYVLAGGEPGDVFRQEVRIVADEVTNSLVILATRKDYDDILTVLRKLDIVPRQVLIEVLVAEVTLGDDLDFGVEWAIAANSRKDALGRITGEPTGSNDNSGNDNSGSDTPESVFDIGKAIGLRSPDVTPIPGSGIFAFISDNRNFAAVLNALAAKNKLKVLSSPHLMTADNHEAHILVGNEVPIITTQSNASNVQTDGTSNILQNIQYRDTGVILTVLPQVNSEGLVNMQIRQEVSQIASTSTGGIQSPTFSTREAETTVVVQSSETIVIGGIIDDTVDHTRSGIPFLMDIPVIGRAFRTERDRVRRTELIVLLTPHVVRDRQESRLATEAFRRRLRMRPGLEKWNEERMRALEGLPIPRRQPLEPDVE
jgi:general secretion pathway protein D